MFPVGEAKLDKTRKTGLRKGGLLNVLGMGHVDARAHPGAVAAICAAHARIWTSGGAPSAPTLREWGPENGMHASFPLAALGTITLPVFNS